MKIQSQLTASKSTKFTTTIVFQKNQNYTNVTFNLDNQTKYVGTYFKYWKWNWPSNFYLIQELPEFRKKRP